MSSFLASFCELVGLGWVALWLVKRLPKLVYEAPEAQAAAEWSEMDLLDCDLEDITKTTTPKTNTNNTPNKLIVTSKLDLLRITQAVHGSLQNQDDHENNIIIIHILVVLMPTTSHPTPPHELSAKLHYLDVFAKGINSENETCIIKITHTTAYPPSSSSSTSPTPSVVLTPVHLALIALSLLVFVVFSSPLISMMDRTTLKPNQTFAQSWLRQFSYATNIPIKLGLVHAFLYAIEFFFIAQADRSLLATHVGQRMTMLWFQLAQHHRLGQHLQMHLETLVQVADCWQTKNNGQQHPQWIKLVLGSIVCGVFMQNAFTSLAYHSLEEQACGFGLFLVKYVWFDLSPLGSQVNQRVGAMLVTSKRQIASGAMLLVFVCVVFNEFRPFHPTAMASNIFLGGALADKNAPGVVGAVWRAFGGGVGAQRGGEGGRF